MSLLPPIYPVPTPPVNQALGSDLAGIGDLTPQMSEVSGRTALAQSIARRLITPRGALIYDANYGYDLTGFINADVTQADVARIIPSVTSEILKDQRVINCSVSMQYVGINQVQAAINGIVTNPNPVPLGAIVIAITLQDSAGPFTLTLSVTNVTVQILQVASG